MNTEEKINSLLRRKQELETVQKELKQLRLQQKLLSDMESQVSFEHGQMVAVCRNFYKFIVMIFYLGENKSHTF